MNWLMTLATACINYNLDLKSKKYLVSRLIIFHYAGSAQSTPPPQCVQNFRIEQDRIDLYIMPGVVNCFSCALDTTGGSVSWQVELDGDLVPVSTSPDTVVSDNFLVIAMPDDYVQPGTSGRREISCSVNNQYLEARLVSPSKQARVDDY